MRIDQACAKVRRWLQEQHDRQDPAGADSVTARAAEVHLRRCPDCRRFREFLAGYGRELAASLDAEWGRPPLADSAPRPRRLPARWALPAAAAALLAAAIGSQAPRLAAGARTELRIRAETAALVEELYSRPLAQGVEVGLAGGGLMEDLLEGLDEGDGLQDLGDPEDLDLGEDPGVTGGGLPSL